MLTMVTNSWIAQHHAVNREGTAALCRKNLVPYQWPTYKDAKYAGTTAAIYEVSGNDQARKSDSHRITCLPCLKKLANLLDVAYPEAHHLYGDALARTALEERADRKATVSEISYLVIDEETGYVYEVLGTQLAWFAPAKAHRSKVWLRDCKTGLSADMWLNTFTTMREFRALPLDQISQDRKDARLGTQIEIDAAASEISYLVVDEDPNSEDHGTVFEVLGTGLDADSMEIVYLRNCGTDEAHIMTPHAMMVARKFRALPLDQVSQDRMDAAEELQHIEIADDEFAKLRAMEARHEAVRVLNSVKPSTAVEIDASTANPASVERFMVRAEKQVSTERQLGRALELLRQLHAMSMGQRLNLTYMSVINRAGRFLAELDAE